MQGLSPVLSDFNSGSNRERMPEVNQSKIGEREVEEWKRGRQEYDFFFSFFFVKYIRFGISLLELSCIFAPKCQSKVETPSWTVVFYASNHARSLHSGRSHISHNPRSSPKRRNTRVTGMPFLAWHFRKDALIGSGLTGCSIRPEIINWFSVFRTAY